MIERKNVSFMLQSFAIAMSLLTRIPLPRSCWSENVSSNAGYSASILWYPIVGLVLAVCLFAVYFLLSSFGLNQGLLAALILCAWIGLTGALHLDGLADCSDAIFAAHSNKKNPLDVMKDPHSGAIAIVSIVLVLLVKFSALEHLLTSNEVMLQTLLVALVFSRCAVTAFMLCTPYVRQSGIATNINPNVVRKPLFISWVILLLVSLLLLPPIWIISTLASMALLLFWWRKKWIKMIGGYTGDCVGGLIELSESLILVLAVILL